jgi:hypothetical protein
MTNNQDKSENLSADKKKLKMDLLCDVLIKDWMNLFISTIK